MAKNNYFCAACGSLFSLEQAGENPEAQPECPICHSHETQIELSLFTVYGYEGEDDGGCGGGYGFS